MVSKIQAAPTENSSELTQLSDIHLPDPIGWWPLAPGWYLVLILLLLILLFGVTIIIHRYRDAKAKRHALKLLNKYQQQYVKDKNYQPACARMSELLKRVALVYFPRKDVACLQGTAWLDFLDSNGKETHFRQLSHLMLEAPYHANACSVDESDVQRLFDSAKKWISQRRKPCSN